MVPEPIETDVGPLVVVTGMVLLVVGLVMLVELDDEPPPVPAVPAAPCVVEAVSPSEQPA